MTLFRGFRSRPWPATAAVAVIVAAVLLFVPVSYQKVVGHDVILSISVPDLSPEQVKKIASEFQNALHPANLSVTREDGGGPVLTARVSGRSSLPVTRTAQAFATALAAQGIPSTAQVKPRVDRILANVIAYARDNIINVHVSSDGKTPAQIEAEIREQLAAAGVENPSVEYRKEGDQTTLMLTMEKSVPEGGGGEACCPEVNVTIDGQTPGGGDAGQKREIRVHRTEGMTDQDFIAEVQRQLRDQGVDADVTLENGRIVINRRNP